MRNPAWLAGLQHLRERSSGRVGRPLEAARSRLVLALTGPQLARRARLRAEDGYATRARRGSWLTVLLIGGSNGHLRFQAGASRRDTRRPAHAQDGGPDVAPGRHHPTGGRSVTA